MARTSQLLETEESRASRADEEVLQAVADLDQLDLDYDWQNEVAEFAEDVKVKDEVLCALQRTYEGKARALEELQTTLHVLEHEWRMRAQDGEDVVPARLMHEVERLLTPRHQRGEQTGADKLIASLEESLLQRAGPPARPPGAAVEAAKPPPAKTVAVSRWLGAMEQVKAEAGREGGRPPPRTRPASARAAAGGGGGGGGARPRKRHFKLEEAGLAVRREEAEQLALPPRVMELMLQARAAGRRSPPPRPGRAVRYLPPLLTPCPRRSLPPPAAGARARGDRGGDRRPDAPRVPGRASWL